MNAEVRAVSISEGFERGRIGEPITIGPNEKVAMDVLGLAVERQMAEQRAGRFNHYLQRPIETFMNDPVYEDLIQTTVDTLPEIKDEEDYRKGFRGMLFEEISYRVLSDKYRAGRVVISPQDTLDFFEVLHPEKRKTAMGFQRSIDGIYVPDGLLVDPASNRVVNILEYTSDLKRKLKGRQIYGAGNLVFSMRSLASAKFTIVYPSEEDPVQLDQSLDRVKFLDLPFSKEEFMRMEQEMFDLALDKLGWMARSIDFADWFAVQNKKYIRYHDNRTLTKAWRNYGRNHRLEIEHARKYPQG